MCSLGDHDDEIQHTKRNSILDTETQPFDNELTMGSLGDHDDDYDIPHIKRNLILNTETQPFDNELTMGALGILDDDIQHTKRNSILDRGDIERSLLTLRENDNEIQYTTRNSILDCGDIETQPFDSQYSPLPGERFEGKDFDELQFLQNTLPFVDAVPFEDAFETQIMNFGGETQVLDDLDGVENMATQLIDESDNEVVDTDGEGTDGAEILGDTEESSDDDPVERDFTSVSAAALRASGLAARNKAFKGTNSESCSIKNEDQFSKQHIAEDNGVTVARDSSTFREEVDQEDFQEEYNEKMKGLRDENKCKVGSSAVTRLFLEDTLAEPKGPNDDKNNADGGADLSQLPACGNEMAGLSYVDSQEPGDLCKPMH
ncbi:hypothetical protein LOK49_LG06G03188 [Camellia lanceoleosa]|uniref:Uncharacterized protein n=1 Tax=Camellia lanceoleosa TaxID=1840588 RepID=A0ACC0HI38_9ERIC|nr:hypothetical protein LOK49_LG06G03188 [Camellia lanceoleosa]